MLINFDSAPFNTVKSEAQVLIKRRDGKSECAVAAS